MSEETARGGNTRLEIVQAAHLLFTRQGYHGTSMRQIAGAAGIALGSIYNHFNSKEGVFVAVLQAYHPYQEVLAAAEAAQGETLESFVSSVAAQMVATLSKHPGFLNLMLIEIVEFNSQHVPLLFSELFPKFAAVGEKLVSQRGRLRPIPMYVLLRAFIGLFFSYYVTEALIGGMIPVEMKENALEHFADIFLYGIVERVQAGSPVAEE